MAGWLLVWTQGESQPDPTCWERSARAAVRYGGAFSDLRQGRAALGVWRRGSGEFPASGTMASFPGAQVAWLGQCVEDGGDASPQAMSVLAADRFDEAAAARLNGPFAAAVIRAQPFQAFTIHLPEGRNVRVAHHDFAFLSPDGRTLCSFQPDRSCDMIDVMLISSIHLDPKPEPPSSAVPNGVSLA